jgi:hypothetical protein
MASISSTVQLEAVSYRLSQWLLKSNSWLVVLDWPEQECLQYRVENSSGSDRVDVLALKLWKIIGALIEISDPVPTALDLPSALIDGVPTGFRLVSACERLYGSIGRT